MCVFRYSATDGPGGVAHNANAMEEHMTSLTLDMLTLSNNQIRLSTAYSSLQSGVPSAVDTLNDFSTAGTMSGTHVAASALTDMGDAAEVQALNQIVPALWAGTCPPSPRRPSPRPNNQAPPACGTPKAITKPTTEWRQWNVWCHSCGVNLNHNSPDCTWQHLPDHKDEATRDNPMGSPMKPNAQKKGHFWMRWCCPVTHTPFKL
jgi:hypothetical protein